MNIKIMGNKGDKSNKDAVLAAELFVEKIASISGITSKKMFGGHGVFHEGKMFGMVDSKGQKFLKANDSISKDFEAKGSHKHSRMPYFSIPEEIFNDQDELLGWVGKSIEASK